MNATATGASASAFSRVRTSIPSTTPHVSQASGRAWRSMAAANVTRNRQTKKMSSEDFWMSPSAKKAVG